MGLGRFERLAKRELSGGLTVVHARSVRSRLLGLAFLEAMPDDLALLIPHCSSVHTLWMRFRLDVVFLDRSGRVLRTVHAVPPRRVLRQRGAGMVLETSSGAADRFLSVWPAASRASGARAHQPS